MLNNILKLQGAKQLAKNEQQHISGGTDDFLRPVCSSHSDCPIGYCCNDPQNGWCTLSGTKDCR